MTPGGKITPHLSFRNTYEEFVCDKIDKKRFLHRLYTRFFLFNSSNVYSDSSSFII